MYICKKWHERLFVLKRKHIKEKTARIPIFFAPITKENAPLVRELRGKEYEAQFLKQLDDGDFGYYAYADGKPVGYGWAKHAHADDFFFKIGEGVVYLCRFFVHESMRGQGIYPALITALMQKESETDIFYIAVERGNESSERGLKKVGFTFVGEYGFWRILKKTLNKALLRKDMTP